MFLGPAEEARALLEAGGMLSPSLSPNISLVPVATTAQAGPSREWFAGANRIVGRLTDGAVQVRRAVGCRIRHAVCRCLVVGRAQWWGVWWGGQWG